MKHSRRSFNILIQIIFIVFCYGGVWWPASAAERDAANEAYVNADWAQAARLYGALTKATPTDARAWYRLGVSLRSDGHSAEALKALEKAAELGTPPSFVDYERARAHLQQDDISASMAALKRAVEAGFNNPDVLREEAFATLAERPQFTALLKQAHNNRYPCDGDPAFHQFDFWLGEWEVTAGGQYAGSNQISARESGCVLFEQWTGAGGSTGISMNYYDAGRGKWVQLWHSASGVLIKIEGGLQEGSMVLVGELQNVRTGLQAPFRGTWTPLEDGRVRQFFEQYNEEGDSWAPWFEGFYKRKASAGS